MFFMYVLVLDYSQFCLICVFIELVRLCTDNKAWEPGYSASV